MRARPSWPRLCEVASTQEGYFTTEQAAVVGFSTQLLNKHLVAGRIRRSRRCVYRLAHIPVGDHEALVVWWLWSERAGIFSHETALALHNLSDPFPGQVRLILPTVRRARRIRAPAGVDLHYADVDDHDRTSVGPLPVTSARRTLADCAASDMSVDTIREALGRAIRRRLVTKREAEDIERAIAEAPMTP